MATGSGKTITAISAIKNIRSHDIGSLILIVVPLRNLAKQWVSDLEDFNFSTLLVSSDNPGWDEKLRLEVVNMVVAGDDYKGPVIVVVEDSFKASKFQKLLAKFSDEDEIDKLIIVDECHHFNKPEQLKKLPGFFNFRMGLSATPFNRYDKENDTFYLLKYFKKIVITYTLDEAITDGFLTPYNYYVVPVKLNADEEEHLAKINKNIAIAIDNGDEDQRNIQSGKKVRLLASVKDKLKKLEELIDGNKRYYALAYCGAASDGEERVIEKVTKIFDDKNWRVGRITADESMRNREATINSLEQKEKNVIVSIQVLDEGIDIPCCQTAYILSSSKNDRQFIQRRGRVLRTHKKSGKKSADIYDFAIMGGATSNDRMEELVKEEFKRIYEFARSAKNKDDIFNKYPEELKPYEKN